MRVLDIFCGAGGAALGYLQAGHEVTGVDHVAQPRYPGTFIRSDALRFLADNGGEYDVIHASPPCQANTSLLAGRPEVRARHRDLLPEVRGLLVAGTVPWIMENVPGAIMRRDLVLCGQQFGLPLYRHRYFEMGRLTVPQPPHTRHGVEEVVAVYGNGGGAKGTRERWREALGLPHAVTRRELANAIPPAYTRYIGQNWQIYA